MARPRVTATTGPAAAPQPEKVYEADPDDFVPAWWLSGNREVFKPFGMQPAERIAKMKEAAKEKITVEGMGASPLTLTILEQAVKHEDYRVRLTAAVKLGEVGTPAHAKLLEPMLNDQNRDVQRAAALGLGLLGDPAQVEPLTKIVENKQEKADKRGYALTGLGFTGGAMLLDAEISSRPRDTVTKDAAYVKISDLVKKYLAVQSANTEDMELAIAAAAAAEQLQNEALAEDLIALTDTEKVKKEEVSSFAAAALGRVQSEKGLDRLLEIVSGSRNQPLPEKKDHVRASAYMAIGQFAELPEAKAAKVAASLVEKLDKKKKAVYEKDLFPRNHLMIALARFGAANPNFAATIWGATAGYGLKDRSTEGSAEEKGFAAYGAALLLTGAGSEKGKDYKTVRADVTVTLARNLDKETDMGVKAANAVALGLLKEKSALPKLKELALKYINRDDFYPHAFYAIAYMGEKTDVKFFEKVLDDNFKDKGVVWNAAIACGILYDNDVPAPIFKEKLLSHKSSEIRSATAIALGVTRNRNAVSMLAEQYKKEDQDFVCEKIVSALGEIDSKFGASAWSMTARSHNYKLNTSGLQDLF
ncbi:MAG: HEAT repeat domain-containing protein [Planctomycetes bacterium]|nr:HEAT repeat domain-containing protein [Planctomycetota bacterium]